MGQPRSLVVTRPGVLGLCVLGLVLFGSGSCRRAELGARAEHGKLAFEERGEERRRLMNELELQGVSDRRVLAAMQRVPRHAFVPPELAGAAYANRPLPIGSGQTISQPYIVAAMTEALELSPQARVLEIGTGSGYQAAVLAELAGEVFSIEILPELADGARRVLADLGYDEVRVRTGDGWLGWPEEAPFDRILLTAAPEEIPAALLEQLAPGGRLVAPIGPQGQVQDLRVVTRDLEGRLDSRSLGAVRFVPMTGGER